MRGVKWLLPLLAVACDAKSRACRAEMERAQEAVKAVDAKSIDSVRASLALVSSAHAACERAELGHEREQLLRAKNELSAQAEALERRASRQKRSPPTPEQLKQLVQNGDPSCPKGQAYLERQSKREIRCSGPQLLEMGRDALARYYVERSFRVTETDATGLMKAERGAELYGFAFDAPGAASPKCVLAYPPPGTSWQEAVARLSGLPPERLKSTTSVKAVGRDWPLVVEGEAGAPRIRLGQCQGVTLVPP